MASTDLETRAAQLPAGLQPLLKKRELQAYFGVSHWTVDQWLKAGCPVRRTPSRGLRFDLPAVERWMDEAAEQDAQSA
ncbi:hypothetical protein [Streptomyces sp. NPDC005322]|uniref:hypothetical protein n=1 Tax=Streptomyces sp. NPDC005322 TaxID=3157032 RepID=UPI0033B2F3FC